jgi:hypothetical protein
MMDAWVADNGEDGMSQIDRGIFYSAEFRNHLNSCDTCSDYLGESSQKIMAAQMAADDAVIEVHLLDLFGKRGLLGQDGRFKDDL